MRLLQEAIRDLRANRLRAALTGLSLFLGVLSVVVIYTSGAIVRDVFVATEEQKDGRAVTVLAPLPYGLLTQARLASILRSLNRRIETRGGSYALVTDVPGAIGEASSGPFGPPLLPTQITLLAGHLDRVRRLPVLEGRWLRPDAHAYPSEVMVNISAARTGYPLGTRVLLQPNLHEPPYPALVVGVIADGEAGQRTYASMGTALTLRLDALSGASIQTFVHHPTASVSEIKAALADVASDVGADGTHYDAQRYDRVAQLLSNLQATQTAFLGAAVVTLLVAAIGSLNIGLASVRERSRELVIRRAVGATRSRLFALVLSSGIWLLGLLPPRLQRGWPSRW